MTTSDDKPTGYNGHAYFTIDDIAAMLPSPARLMPEVGNRWWKAYYAAKEGNWPLAEFQVKEIEELIDTCMITRPKYAQWMEPFIADDLGNIKKAIKAGDWANSRRSSMSQRRTQTTTTRRPTSQYCSGSFPTTLPQI